MMVERLRVLVYSERSDKNNTWLIYFDEYDDIICVNSYDVAEIMLTTFVFHIVIIDIRAFDKYDKISDILYQRNLSTKIRVVEAPRLKEGGGSTQKLGNDSAIQQTEEEKNADALAGIKKTDALVFDDLKIDPNSRRVTFKDKEIKLTTLEFELLHCFAKHYDKVLNYDQIFSLVWHDNQTHGDEVIKAHLHRLRKKLSVTNRDYITNVRGKGYRFSK